MVKSNKMFFRATEIEKNYIKAVQQKFMLESSSDAIRWLIHQNIRLTELLDERKELIRIIDEMQKKIKVK
jgi:hypothetical protein